MHPPLPSVFPFPRYPGNFTAIVNSALNATVGFTANLPNASFSSITFASGAVGLAQSFGVLGALAAAAVVPALLAHL